MHCVLIVSLLLVTNAAAQMLPDGVSCTAATSCESRICKTRCCSTATPANCAVCNVFGGCKSCITGFNLVGANCIAATTSVGAACSTNNDCVTDACRSACCLAGIVSSCMSCAAGSGQCTSCSTGYYATGTAPGCALKKNAGSVCTFGSMCTSNVCKNGKCCKSPMTSGSQCTSCDNHGMCTACSGVYTVSAGGCVPKKDPGGSCTASSQCLSNVCLSNYCCKNGVTTASCNSCTATGACNGCNTNYYPSGGLCSLKEGDGNSCGANIQCNHGLCLDSRCCKSGINSRLCTSCRGSGGSCSACASTSHYVDSASGTCQTKKSNGDSCPSNVACTSGTCETRCCSSPFTQYCATCGLNGACTACVPMRYLVGTTCFAKRAAGFFCGDHDHHESCISGKCERNCCNSGMAPQCTMCGTNGWCISCLDTHYLSNGNCTPRTAAGTACADDDHCQSRICRSGVCCVEGAVSQCTSCSGRGWCTTCAPQWYVGGTLCRHIDSRSVSQTLTISLPPTPTATPSPSTSHSTTLSSSTSASVSATLSMVHTETLTLESTTSLTITTTADATATLSLSVTASLSVSAHLSQSFSTAQTLTETPPLTVSNQLTATVSYSLTTTTTISVTTSVSSTPSTPISTSVTASLIKLHAELLNGTTVESWVIGREPHSQALKIQLTGERLDPTLFNFNTPSNQARAIEVSFLANPLAANDTVSSPCTAYVTTREAMFGTELAANSTNDGVAPAALKRYIDRNTTVVATSERDIEVWFPPSPGFAMDRDTELTLWLTRGCLASRRPFMPVNFTLLESPVLKGVPDAVMDASRAIADAAVAVGGIGSPAVATQLSRSTIILGLVECSPSDETLTVSQSPFGLELLDSGVGQYVGGALLNHVASLLFAGLLVCIALAVGAQSGKGFRQGFRHGCEVARFPSLLAFSSMLLIEPTAMCCMVVLLYAGTGVKTLGGVSLVLLVAMPLATLAYFRPRRGEFAYHPLWDEPRNAALLFFFGRCKWTDRDGPHSTGFCQRHRLFFGDYVGSRWYFLAVEMGMSIVCGAIDGLKLGLGRCNGVAIALFVVLLLYVVLLLVARPYNNAFLLVFAFTLAVLQLIGAGLMMVHLQFGSARAFVAAEWVSVACMWLLSLRMVFDIAPKTYLIYKAVRRAVGGAAAKLVRPRGKSQRFEDMRERVLYAMDDEKAPDLDTAVRAVDAREEALLADLDRILGDSNDDDTNFFPSDYEDDDDFYPPGYLDDDAPVYYEGGARLGDYADGEFEQEMDSIDELLGGAMKRDPDALRFDDGGVGGSAEELWSSMVEMLGPALETAGNFTATQQEQMSQRFKELDGELRRLKIAAADGNATAQSALERLPPNNQVLAMLDDSEATMLQHALEAVPGFEAQMLLRRLTTTRSLVAERVAISKEQQQQQRDDVTTPLRPLSDIGVDRLVVGDDDVDLDNNTGKPEDVSEKMTTKAASSRSPSQINSSCPSVEVSVSVTPTISVRGSVGDLVDLNADRDDL